MPYSQNRSLEITEPSPRSGRLQEAKASSDRSDRLERMIAGGPAVLCTASQTGAFGTTFVSDNVRTQLGFEPEAFTADPGLWASRIHPDDAPRVFTDLLHLFEQGTHTDECRFRASNGRYRWMHDQMRLVTDAAGEAVEFVGYCADITEGKRAEAELRESEAKFRALFEQASIGVAQVDVSTGEFVRINRRHCDIVGYGPGELTALGERAVTHPGDRVADEEGIRRRVSGETREFSVEKRIVH